MAEAPNTPNFRIEHVPFEKRALTVWAESDPKHRNWPVVYTINNDSEVYIGESTSAANRMMQHLANSARKGLRHARIVLDDSFNKSACLDLESRLIQIFAGDPKYSVQNLSLGIVESDYFDREKYQARFDEIFEELVKGGVLSRSIPDIVNSDLFKFSPFKSLNQEQSVAVEGILEQLAEEIETGAHPSMVVQGDPGTGKTIVAVYLLKLIADIARSAPDDVRDVDSMFADFFQAGYRELFTGLRTALVIPQQSLRKTIKKVFRNTPGLHSDMVIGPFDVGNAKEKFDLLLVDESHRLGRRSNQSSAMQNRYFRDINVRLFGEDRDSITQLDWIRAQSKHQVLLLDKAQSVRPSDISHDDLDILLAESARSGSLFNLVSQMRVSGGNDYIEYVRKVFDGNQSTRNSFGNYDVRLFHNITDMRKAIVERDAEFGLARLVAGFAWKWISKKEPKTPDITIGDVKLFWNRTAVDWVNSPTALEEVGSIHTVQGYDLNYAGVIIGRDLYFNETKQRIEFSRENYFDARGKENLSRLGLSFNDEEILELVKNIYRVLMTRGIKGTYIYVCDEPLRRYLAKYFPLN